MKRSLNGILSELILHRILKNGSSYPGKHNYPTERTSPACKPLEPKSQVWLIIIDGINSLDDDYLEINDWILEQQSKNR